MHDLKKSLIAVAVPALNPLCRFAMRLNPALTDKLWSKFVRPKLSWRHFEFTERARFGGLFAGDTFDHIQRAIYYFGVWEPQVGAMIERRFRGGLFVDIGANIGYFSILTSKIPGSYVVAIEPQPRTFERLRKNVEINQARNVRLINAAVTDYTGTARLYGPVAAEADNSGMASLYRPSGEFDDVACAPLSELLREEEIRSVSFIKIDVEGAEHLVMKGIFGIMDRLPRTAEVLVELSVSFGDTRGDDIVGEMRSRGYYAYALEEDRMTGYCHSDPQLAKPFTRLTRRTDVLFTRVQADAV